MPYIERELRDHFRPHCPAPQTAGELNFQITCIIMQYINARGIRYSHINDVLGALEGAKLEFYRRVASPYESKKIEENGDVY